MKRSRTQNDVLDCVELGKHLEPYAKLKTAPWDWEVAGYGKTRRSQGPDRQGLEAYEKLLQVIRLAAPTGHPPLYRLREVWVWLHKEHNIMASDIQKRGMPVSDWASQSADNIRLMCKHLLDLRASRTTFLSPTLAALVGMIAEDKEPALPAPETMPKKILQAQASAASSVCFCVVLSASALTARRWTRWIFFRKPRVHHWLQKVCRRRCQLRARSSPRC
jgi:hypothetical protein